MIIKKIIVLTFMFFGIFFTNAQIFTLKGNVKDSLQNPLSYANVIAKPSDITKNLQFSITDDDGYYKLELNKGETFTITVSYMGFKTASFEFIAKDNLQKNIV